MNPVTVPTGIHLSFGAHEPNDDGEYCFVEAWAHIRGLDWSDCPDCMSPVIGAFLRSWNDALLDPDRTRLLAPLLTREFPAGDEQVEERRSYLALDWLIRTFTPTFLRLVPALASHADALAALPEITDLAAAITAKPHVNAARAAAGDATGVAARAAAWVAAEAAARDAAEAAARDAARAATGVAARAAAWVAAEAAAWDAVWAVLDPTVETLQASALELIARMEAAA